MQVHGPNAVIRKPEVGEYHTGAVAIYLGGYAIVTHTAEDCDMLLAAACEAKRRHLDTLNPGRAALRATIEGLAIPADDERCPRCDSPDPKLHPAMQAGGGEIQPCPHPWHGELPEWLAKLVPSATEDGAS